MYAVLLALVAVSGYVYCNAHHREYKKLVWHSKRGGLYYRYAAYGLLFTILGYFAYLDVYNFRPAWLVSLVRFLIKPIINEAIPVNWKEFQLIFGTTLFSIFFSFFLGKIFSIFYRNDNDGVIEKELKESDDSFSRMLLIAMRNRLTVLINLDGSKVYVGYPLEFYSPYREHSWLQILPVMSGYRKEFNKELVLETDYEKTIHGFIKKKLNALRNTRLPPRIDDFALTINMDRIQSITIFDIPLYVEKVLGQRKGSKTRQNQKHKKGSDRHHSH